MCTCVLTATCTVESATALSTCGIVVPAYRISDLENFIFQINYENPGAREIKKMAHAWSLTPSQWEELCNLCCWHLIVLPLWVQKGGAPSWMLIESHFFQDGIAGVQRSSYFSDPWDNLLLKEYSCCHFLQLLLRRQRMLVIGPSFLCPRQTVWEHTITEGSRPWVAFVFPRWLQPHCWTLNVQLRSHLLPIVLSWSIWRQGTLLVMVPTAPFKWQELTFDAVIPIHAWRSHFAASQPPHTHPEQNLHPNEMVSIA